jgi:Cu(I)/Ag(I) efflux system membrane fusion protein
MLTENQMRLANITTGIATRNSLGEKIAINGTLKVNEEFTESVTSRVDGRVEKLYIKETGRSIKKGEPLYVLYSESLLTLQREYLLAKDQYESMEKKENRYKAFMDAAERKLMLYGLAKEQIAKLTRNSAMAQITFLAPVEGVITEIQATEGQYVQEGGILFKVENLKSLWIEAELYSDERSLIKLGDKIAVGVPGSESSTLEARVDFLSPEFRTNGQILVMRAELKNPDLKLKPGQQVQVFVEQASHVALTVPTDAVIRDGKGAHVYVQSAQNTFQPRVVKTGIEGSDHVEIIEGLSEGDTLAVTGAYLLYSELTLRGMEALSGHNH